MFPQAGFENSPLTFNGVQVEGVGRQIFQGTAFAFDECLRGF